MTNVNAIDGNGNDVNISNCQNTTARLGLLEDKYAFSDGNLSLYGKGTGRIKVCAGKLYANSIAGKRFYAYNVDLLGGVEDKKGDVEYYNMDGNTIRPSAKTTIILDNVNMRGYMVDNLYKASDSVAGSEIRIFKTVNIIENRIKDKIIDLNSESIYIDRNATLTISSNSIISKQPTVVSMGDNTNIYAYGSFNVYGNTFKKESSVSVSRVNAVYVGKNSKIHVGTESVLTINENKNDEDTLKENETHAYQIYSDNKDGFIVIDNGRYDARDSKVEVYINNTDGEGVVIDNWTTDTVVSEYSYEEMISLDKYYTSIEGATYNTIWVGSKVIIQRHKNHKVCGVNEGDACVHQVITTHSDGVAYVGLTSRTSIPTSGNYYLLKNVVLDRDIVLTGNLNLCLNGQKLDMNGHIIKGKDYAINITSCYDGANAEIVSSSSDYLFNNRFVEIFGISKSNSIKIFTNKLATFKEDSQHRLNLFNVDIKGTGDLVESLVKSEGSYFDTYNNVTISSIIRENVHGNGIRLHHVHDYVRDDVRRIRNGLRLRSSNHDLRNRSRSVRSHNPYAQTSHK